MLTPRYNRTPMVATATFAGKGLTLRAAPARPFIPTPMTRWELLVRAVARTLGVDR
jgi:hypothetical protein